MSSYFSFSAIHPHDAYVLHRATMKAAATLRASDEMERHGLADAVFAVAKSGYARSLDGTLDPDALAEAAVARFRSAAITTSSEAAKDPIICRQRDPMFKRAAQRSALNEKTTIEQTVHQARRFGIPEDGIFVTLPADASQR